MRQRNWNDLSRKLVDRYDMSFTLDGMSQDIDQFALDFFGEGVLSTTRYPNPFPITLSGALLGGSVGNGVAFDPSGNQTGIGLPNQTGTPTFTIPTADPTNTRWDLLVITYAQVGDTPVPKPSDPITTINLNLHDDFVLAVRPGIPSATPSYPTKQSGDVILAGIQVPAGVTLGTSCLLDLSIREVGIPDIVKLPKFKKEIPGGLINNSNTTFNLSLPPLTASGVFLFLDGAILPQSVKYTIAGQVITMITPPAYGQVLYVFYVVDYNSSQNPITGMQEAPTGLVDGINDSFTFGLGTPADKSSTTVFVDGAPVNENYWSIVYTPSFTYIKFLPGYLPQPAQDVYATYFVNSNTVGVANNSGRPIYEIPLGTVDGINTDFTLTLGRPLDKISTGVLIDGELIDPSTWIIIYNQNNSIIRFISDQPVNSQSIAVNYFIKANVGSGSGITNINNLGSGIGLFDSIIANAANFKSLVQGSGITLVDNGTEVVISAPSVSGGYSPHGSNVTPIIINAAVGIVSTLEQRQLWIITSTGGAQTVTANPQISPGITIGQEMLLSGISDIDYLILNDGNGLSLNGQVKLTSNEVLPLFWRGDVWREISRS